MDTKVNKWHVMAGVLGMVALFILINYTILPVYKVGCCVFNGNRTCGEEFIWDGDCSSGLAEAIKDKCCMKVDMCAGYETENPSECYHRYCVAADKFCAPGEMNTATMKYSCTCIPTYS